MYYVLQSYMISAGHSIETTGILSKTSFARKFVEEEIIPKFSGFAMKIHFISKPSEKKMEGRGSDQRRLMELH